MALSEECAHDIRGVICPVCDETERDRAAREAEDRKRERARMFGYPGEEYQ